MKVVFVGFNEINFDYVSRYIEQGHLPNLAKLLSAKSLLRTESENSYHLWEPWIQWVTIYTGKSFDEHGVFRLGDIVDNQDLEQIFEFFEGQGHSVGAVSPFNASNRMNKADFFIPDPWTSTKVTGGKLLTGIYETIKALVNTNADMKFSLRHVLIIMLAACVYVPPVRWMHYFKCLLKSRKPGIKALIMDSLLSDIYIKLVEKKSPDFSHLFLNAGAHIQHHYMFSSSVYDGENLNPEWYCSKDFDPLLQILQEYDNVIRRLAELSGIKLVIATGLTQIPCENITYYWRPKHHESLMAKLGITAIKKLEPRMSRDFLVIFDTSEEANSAERILKSYVAGDSSENIFSVDNRGRSLFVELSYGKEITSEFEIKSELTHIALGNFKDYVSFVAIKNGQHCGTGYLILDAETSSEDSIPLTDVRQVLVGQLTAN